MLTSPRIKAKAAEIGFDLCGVSPVDDFPELRFLGEWLARGYAGTMTWLARTARVRRDLRVIMPGARSVIATATVYNVERPYSTEVRDPATALVSRYAWGEDYHAIVGQRLEQLIAWMSAESDRSFEARAYVDTGPVQERVVAQHAGLGWVGKHTCLINERLGSWVFLGEILTTLPLEPDNPVLDRCGTCTLCLDACPTGAIVQPYVLDARRCLSYVTIEYRGSIADELRSAMGAHVFGCDICQDVCPFNHQAATSLDPAWQPRPGLDRPALETLARASDDTLSALVAGGPMTRAPMHVLRRNIAIAMQNVP